MRNEVIAYAPEVAAAIGFVAGIAVDVVARQRGEAKQAAVLSTQGATEAEYIAVRSGQSVPPPIAVETVKKSVGEKVGSTLREPWLPVSMALAAGLCVAAWTQTETHKTATSELNIVADHSFQIGQNDSAKKIASIFDQFKETGKVRVRAFVAHNGSYDAIAVNEINKQTPYGPPSVSSTVSAVFKNAETNRQPRQQALLVVTANNLGNTNTVIKRAKAEHMPLYIANVGNQTGTQVKDLQTIAVDTGGKYWDARTASQNIARTVKSAVKPREITERTPNEDTLAEKIFGGLAVLLAAGLTKSRAALRFRRKNNVSKKGEK